MWPRTVAEGRVPGLASKAVAVLRGSLVALVVLALLSMPCLLLLLVQLDDVLGGGGRALRRGARRVRERRVERRLLRRAGISATSTAAAPPAGPVGPPIECIAADLRRLDGQRSGVATRSPVWFAAVQHAYDDRLTAACRELEVAEHLNELAGVDLDIERVRVEGMLQLAGLSLRGAPVDQR